MRRFKFNLEKILQIRKFKEEECKNALGQAISVLSAIEMEIKNTALKHHNAASQRFSSTNEMLSWDIYILRLEQEAASLSQKAAQAELVVEEKREIYLEASRDLKAIEKLKEKQKSEYREKMLNAQMNEVDEITSARLIRAANNA
ncbi:MAG: flagellar export protein FliJ [Treponema sp.]|nr:flagellar export protein FliJ [Treponema sp.]